MLKDWIDALTDEEMVKAHAEIVSWQNTGILHDGIVRNIFEKYEEETGETPTILIIVEREFLKNMANRYVASVNGN